MLRRCASAWLGMLLLLVCAGCVHHAQLQTENNFDNGCLRMRYDSAYWSEPLYYAREGTPVLLLLPKGVVRDAQGGIPDKANGVLIILAGQAVQEEAWVFSVQEEDVRRGYAVSAPAPVDTELGSAYTWRAGAVERKLLFRQYEEGLVIIEQWLGVPEEAVGLDALEESVSLYASAALLPLPSPTLPPQTSPYPGLAADWLSLDGLRVSFYRLDAPRTVQSDSRMECSQAGLTQSVRLLQSQGEDFAARQMDQSLEADRQALKARQEVERVETLERISGQGFILQQLSYLDAGAPCFILYRLDQVEKEHLLLTRIVYDGAKATDQTGPLFTQLCQAYGILADWTQVPDDMEDGQAVGQAGYGYVLLPKTWVPFTDTQDVGKAIQFSDPEGKCILTLNTWKEEDGDPEEVSSAVWDQMEEEGAKQVQGWRTELDGRDAYQLTGVYPQDDVMISVWIFSSAGNQLHFVSIEGPRQRQAELQQLVERGYRLTQPKLDKSAERKGRDG